MTREILILRKRRTTRQHVRDIFGRFSTEPTKGVIRMINYWSGSYVHNRPLAWQADWTLELCWCLTVGSTR